MNRDTKDLTKALQEAGYTVTRLKNQHLQATGGWRPATFCSTPSDRRSLLNDLSDLRKAGYRFTFRGKLYEPNPAARPSVQAHSNPRRKK